AAIAVWVGNVVGKQNLSRIGLPHGTANRARYAIFRDIMYAVNSEYGGKDWPAPPGSLLRGQQATVPDVHGQSEEQAIALLEGLGFVPQNGGTTPSGLAAGRVVHSKPGA